MHRVSVHVITNTTVRVDNILVSGKSTGAHIRNLEEVLQRLTKTGLRLNAQKCVFFADEVVYLGQKVTSEGVQTVAEEVKAVTVAPNPENVTQLKSYLGMINYYHRYLPNLATEFHALYALLHKGTPWKWGASQEEAFRKSKEMLKSSQLLLHFDSTKEVILSYDASPYGLGAVLAHHMTDGSERPIACASRMLQQAEKNYLQVEKEGLAMIFSVRKFHQYLYGLSFTVYTDHKPLLGLFGENKSVPTMAAERIKRWALMLTAYEYTIQYRKRTENADVLSRLPLTEDVKVPTISSAIAVLAHLETTPVKVDNIRPWTSRDPVCSKVKRYILRGWPTHLTKEEENLEPYYHWRNELSVEEGCILGGQRVVVPSQGRTILLDELHLGHPGICRMKALARSTLWWPNIDKKLEVRVKSCNECLRNKHKPAEAPLHPWEFPGRSWSRLHIDCTGSVQGKMILVIVDSYSKWIEAHAVTMATATATINKLRLTFATHGLPDIIISDNGANFTSEEFAAFMKSNGIKHVRTAPYHPASNGQADRVVQTVKEELQKQEGETLEVRLAKVLFHHR